MILDDLTAGQIVTVKCWRASEDEGSWLFGTTRRRPESHPYCGMPLKVVATCLPYIAVQVMGSADRLSLDTRTVDLMPMPQSYVDALLVRAPAPPGPRKSLLRRIFK